MSLLTPVLRIRKVVRRMGASSEDADEFADAMDAYPTRREFEERMEAMFNRWFTRILLAMTVIVGLAVALIVALN